MNADDLQVGKTYRARRFRGSPTYNNDRIIVWKGNGTVQFDSDTVAVGRRLPRITITGFLRWAAREVTQEELDEYRQETAQVASLDGTTETVPACTESATAEV
jgi:hypothetical protein